MTSASIEHGIDTRIRPLDAIAQVMGHKPSATAEGYRPRTVDALRPYLKQIEDHILKMAGVEFDRVAAKSGLRLVSAEL